MTTNPDPHHASISIPDGSDCIIINLPSAFTYQKNLLHCHDHPGDALSSELCMCTPEGCLAHGPHECLAFASFAQSNSAAFDFELKAGISRLGCPEKLLSGDIWPSKLGMILSRRDRSLRDHAQSPTVTIQRIGGVG